MLLGGNGYELFVRLDCARESLFGELVCLNDDALSVLGVVLRYFVYGELLSLVSLVSLFLLGFVFLVVGFFSLCFFFGFFFGFFLFILSEERVRLRSGMLQQRSR